MKHLIIIFLSLIIWSCSGKQKPSEKEAAAEKTEVVESVQHPNKDMQNVDLTQKVVLEALKDSIDLSMNISKLSLSDIRLLRNAFAARQGYCFMKADLRGIFSTTSWYDERMEERYWAFEEGKEMTPIAYTKAEMAFINRLRKREDELMSGNLITEGDTTKANIDNIINLFQLESANPQLMSKLAENGFAIVPNENIQLFHVYEQNDYQQFPHFVTTDMYLQLFHMYFSYILRTTEEEQFIPLLQEICHGMYSGMQEVAQNDTNKVKRDIAAFNTTYYAIAYSVLTDSSINVPSAYMSMYQNELMHIQDGSDDFSEFLKYENVHFPYSLFKPRGHYTRTETLKRYFKAMMWLQTAPFCLDDDLQLRRAAMSASMMNNTGLFQKYKAILEPVNFIIGQPDNVSFLDLSRVMQQTSIDHELILTDEVTLNVLRSNLREVANRQNRIKPKEAVSCVDKINFMPQRYLADNEVLQELVDVKNQPSKRAFPKGLDVMAVFGSESAEQLLFNEGNETWELYPQKLTTLKEKMSGIEWEASVYNKWIQSLLRLQEKDSRYPYFMQSSQWDKKNLNASLASWAELKHDAILYAEQPMAAECGGGGPPDPITVGYVEPNTAYWKAVIELLDVTRDIFQRNKILDESTERVTTRLRENAEFLLLASEKELKGESLSEQEYMQIEYIGSTFEWLTLDLVKQKDQYLNGWSDVQGPDKSVAVVADIYTSNALNNPDPGVLHVATGHVNDIYVVVEIDGYLYLTKGAVLSYHEFNQPPGVRLTDEEWQSLLENGRAPNVPAWMKEIIVPINPPKSNQKIFYSSGC